jgi:hypothetical protein
MATVAVPGPSRRVRSRRVSYSSLDPIDLTTLVLLVYDPVCGKVHQLFGSISIGWVMMSLSLMTNPSGTPCQRAMWNRVMVQAC